MKNGIPVVCIDPGHGGSGHLTTYGATGHGLREKDLVLKMAFYLRDYLLENFVCEVVLTRDGDYDVSYADRAKVARDHNADIFISLHFNGFHIASANGFETFIYNGSLRAETVENQRIIHRSIYSYLSGLGVTNRGKKRANFAVLRLPPTSCILPEYLFITNPADAEIAKDDYKLWKMSKFTGKGIAEALNLRKKEVNVEEPEMNWRVIYTSKQTLEEAKDELQKIQKVVPTLEPFIAYNEVRDGEYWFRIVVAEHELRDNAVALQNWLSNRDVNTWLLSSWEDLDFPEPEEPEKPEDIPEDDFTKDDVINFLNTLIKMITDFIKNLSGGEV